MKTFNELTAHEQKYALELAWKDLVNAILEGHIRFNDEQNGDDLQARIDAAIAKADAMQTPWFAHEYLQDDAIVRESLQGMAQIDAEDALYPDPNERVISGVVKPVTQSVHELIHGKIK